MDPYQQQWFAAHAVVGGGLQIDEVWANYASLGGTADRLEVQAYLHGLASLESIHRDMVSHSINELLEDAGFPGRPAAYSTDDVSLETGQITDGAYEACTDEALARFVTSYSAGKGSAARQSRKDEEQSRLLSLARTGLLETGAEERFDRITREAREVFGVSSSSLALIGARHQFIKSVTGPIGQNLPRDVSFCNRTIQKDRTLIVRDALLHDDFSTNPQVVERPRIRFYAGHPLTGPGGWRIGSLCIIDDKPREFTMEDHLVLRLLTAEAQRELDTTYR